MFSYFTTTHNAFVFIYSNNSLSVTNHSKLDTCSYKIFRTMTVSPPKVVTVPPESPCLNYNTSYFVILPFDC